MNEVESQNGLHAALAANERSRIAEWFVCWCWPLMNEVESQNGLRAALATNERSRIAEWFACCAGH